MARRTINRMEKRAEYEAYERRQTEEEVETDEEEDDEEEGDEEEAVASEEDGDEDAVVEEEEEEEVPVVKKKKKAKEPKKAKPRSRSTKTARMRVVWGVFNNSNVRVAVYDYPRRKEADEHAARLTTDKKQTHFVQPVKEAIEEKKEA